jgi:hypothetical protein
MLAYGILDMLLDEGKLDEFRANPDRWWLNVQDGYEYLSTEGLIAPPWDLIGVPGSKTPPLSEDASTSPSAFPGFQYSDSATAPPMEIGTPFETVVAPIADPPALQMTERPYPSPSSNVGDPIEQMRNQVSSMSFLPSQGAEAPEKKPSLPLPPHRGSPDPSADRAKHSIDAALEKMFQPASDFQDGTFCEVCHDLEGGKGKPNAMKLDFRRGAIMKLERRFTWQLLQVYAEKTDCASCQLLYQGLKPFLDEYGDEALELRVKDDAGGKEPCLTVIVARYNKLGASMRFVFYVTPGQYVRILLMLRQN